MASPWQDRRVLLGVTGSIAAYKAADIAARLVQEGARVTVIMTAAAQKLVRPATLESLSRSPVVTDLWERAQALQPEHISLAEQADLLLVAPATANFLGKLAHGLADDALTCTALAVTCPVVIAPAMNDNMYAHPAVQANVRLLRERGCVLAGPVEGRLATGKVGLGRMAPIEDILAAAAAALPKT
ncbi:MAG TPA: flavoprotein [Candidatus Brocadiia bacterium]|nr:flavoprotein [Candidatus Brocadiia bacterium]